MLHVCYWQSTESVSDSVSRAGSGALQLSIGRFGRMDGKQEVDFESFGLSLTINISFLQYWIWDMV